jgi:hypothetical protein
LHRNRDRGNAWHFGRLITPIRSEISVAKAPTKPLWTADAVVLKQARRLLGHHLGGHIMWTMEQDNVGSEGWDPALWSIGTVLGVAILYLACLA